MNPRSEQVRRALKASPLYFILDESLCRDHQPLELAAEALSGGVRMLQLRFKGLSSRELLALASAMAELCHKAGCLLIVNDRVDIALLSGADGVHLGADDLPIAAARSIAPQLIIGATARNAAAARRAERDGADCIGCGSVFPSGTKSGLPLIGLEGLAKTAASVSIPVTAIGGIELATCGEVMQSGAAGFSAIGPFLKARSVRSMARRFMGEALRAVKS